MSGARRSPAARRPGPKKGRRPAPKGRARSRPGRRIAAGLAVSVALVGFLLFSVFPTRDWLDQRGETRDRQAELEALEAENAALEREADELRSREAIEREAREKHNMARPGEQVIQVLPEAVPPVELPETWPFTGASDWLNR